jgi:DNA-binding response OmpR family regulator
MAATKKTTDKKVVFVVEDDGFLMKAYQMKLAKTGLEVWSAMDGHDALKFLEKDPPNIVMLDLMLPGVSGFDILETMRKNEKWKKVPVIILTNLGQTQDIERGKKLGIADYIIKANTKINDIIKRVEELMK